MHRPFYKELVQCSPEPCQLAHFTDKKIEDWRECITLPQLIENYYVSVTSYLLVAVFEPSDFHSHSTYSTVVPTGYFDSSKILFYLGPDISNLGHETIEKSEFYKIQNE